MICRKCSFILQGSEKFCPNCGEPCSQKPQNEKTEEPTTPTPPSILFSSQRESEAPETQPKIFRDEPDEEAETVKSKKSKAPMLLIALLVIVVLSVGGVTAMEYFGLAPVIMQYLETGNTVGEDADSTSEKGNDNAETTEGEYSSDLGVISPDISFKPTVCYVSTDKSLPLRKGPDNSYAPLNTLQSGCPLQVIGASLTVDTWVYVYVPVLDCYGWLSSSFLSDETALKSEDETTQEAENIAENTDISLNTDSYTAKVLPDGGVKLREGPGTEHTEILTIPQNETVVVMGSSGDNSAWLYVSYNGSDGYINGSYLQKL